MSLIKFYSGACRSARSETATLSALTWCGVLITSLWTQTSYSQVPFVDLEGLPAEPLIGERYCSNVNFSNLAPSTGYGPYVIGTLDESVINVSINFVDVSPKLDFIGVFDASGILTDPISGQLITGSENASAYIARYPVGSVELATPALTLEACAEVAPGAEIGQPLAIEFIPGFEFGDSATGANGAILGTTVNSTVTPVLARLKKNNSAPENERPPGPSNTFNYRWEMDISALATIKNVVLADDLPPQLQWTGTPITLSARLGVGCQLTALPNNAPTTGGTVEVNCQSVTGTSGQTDLSVTIPVYISDILDETIPDQQAITNTVTADYDYDGIGYSDDDQSTVLAVHAATQKNVSGDPVPGSTLSYTIDFQSTDYPQSQGQGALEFILSDIIPDGLEFVGTEGLTIDGSIVAISETVSANTPGLGQTSVTWDIGDAAGGLLSNGSNGRLRYQTLVREDYASNNAPVLAADTLTNDLELTFMLEAGGDGSDGSTADADITKNKFEKIVSNPPQPSQLMPGQEVTFRLTADLPAGNTSSLQLIDYLPRPVFDVSQSPPLTVTVLPPFDSVAILPPVIDAGQNSITLNFDPIDSPTDSQLVVELRARVTSQPFADDLYLTNILAASYTNSDGDTFQKLQAAEINVGAPELVITKGVSAADNSAVMISPAPPTNPAAMLSDSDASGADAFDNIQYTITVENIGGQNAYSVMVTDSEIPGKLSCDQPAAGDVVSGAGIALAFTGNLYGAGGLVLTDPLPGNDGSPAGGGAPFSNDTAIITINCQLGVLVSPAEAIINTATVDWVSTDGGSEIFPIQDDDATLSIALPQISKRQVATTPNYTAAMTQVHIGEIVTYEVEITVPEGTSPAVRFEDLLDEGAVFLDSAQPACNEVVCINTAGALATDVPGGFAAIEADNAGLLSNGSGDTAPDRKLVIGPSNKDNGFGTITNSGNSNGTPETITVRYRARVLNSPLNQSGTSLRNRARWEWLPNGATERQRVQAKADFFDIVEPVLSLSKVFTPSSGDQLTAPLVTLTFTHTGASNAEAFDLRLTEALPLGMGIQNHLAPDTAIVRSNCPAEVSIPSIVRQGFSDTLTIEWSNYVAGSANCTISFQTEFLLPVVAGENLVNCAQLSWQSLFSGNQPLAGPPNNAIAVERTGDTADPGGAANDYRVENCDRYSVLGVGISKQVVATDQPQTDNVPGTPPGTESLTIGETVTFEIVATMPETASLELKIVDSLPRTEQVLELLSATTLPTGGEDLTPSTSNPVPLITDESGDGINDTVALDYGLVRHTLDGITNDRDRVYVRVVAKVRDHYANVNNDRDVNNAIVQFLPSLSASDEAALEIVEPILNIDKVADTDQVEAGDIITYRLTVSHDRTSRTAAENLRLEDVLPSKLALVDNSAVVGRSCTFPPDSGPAEVGNSLIAGWTEFPLAATCVIEFQATVNTDALAGEKIENVATIDWTSLRNQGAPDNRLYQRDDLWPVIVSEPGIDKQLTASSVDETPTSIGSGSEGLTIGEVATFTISASFSEGTVRDVSIRDLLPGNTVALEFTDAKILSIGSDLIFTESSPARDDPGVSCSPPGDNCRQWVLGTVVNPPDTRPEPDLQDSILFSVSAVVLDDPLNSGAPGEDENLINLSELLSPDIQLAAPEVFDIVEPSLLVTKLVDDGSFQSVTAAGMEHEFVITLRHRPISTATAHNIQLRDALNSQMEWIDDSTVISDCPNLSLNASPLPGNSGQIEFEIPQLSLARDSCSIRYRIKMSDTLALPDFYTNQAFVSWDSTPVADDVGETRRYFNQGMVILYAFSDAGVAKLVASTSLDDTGSANFDPAVPDAAIGEIIEYAIITKFSEGVTQNVSLIDAFQNNSNGQLELVGGSVVFIGANVSTSTPAIPMVTSNAIEIDYGEVTNLPDTPQSLVNKDDTIVYRLELLVKDVPSNTAGIDLTNDIQLIYDDITNSPRSISDDAIVDVVEPMLNLDKKFTLLADAVATIELNLSNSGTAPAYDTQISDQFDEAVWLPGSLMPVQVPAGYELLATSSGGVTTVTLQAATPLLPPSAAEVLSPGEVFRTVFTMTLQNNGQPGPTNLLNTANAEATSLPGSNPKERTYTVAASDTLLLPALSFEKAWTGPNNPALPGDTLKYTLTLTNTGDGDVNNVLITDTPDASGELQTGSITASTPGTVQQGNSPGDTDIAVAYSRISAGETAILEYQVLVPLPFPDGLTAAEQLVNQGLADSDELPGLLSDDPATPTPGDATIVPVLADPIMVIDKSDGVAFALPGDTLSYTIEYANAGNQDATGVVITETVPASTRFSGAGSDPGWSCADGAPAGSSCTLTVGPLSGGVSESAIFAATILNPVGVGVIAIANTTTIAEDGFEFGQPPSAPSVDSANAVTPLFARPVIEVVKTDLGISVVPGQIYKYRLVYANTGTQQATGLTLTETVPDDVVYNSRASLPDVWSCPNGSPPGTVCTLDGGDLAGGSGGLARFGLQVVSPADAGVTAITNTVLLEDDGSNGFGILRDEASDATPLIATHDLEIHKTSDGGALTVGRVITYQLAYRNIGDQNVSSASVTEIVPANTEFSMADSLPTDWSCADGSPGGTFCSHSVGSVSAGTGGVLTFAVRVTARPDSGRIINIAEIGIDGTTIDSNLGNNLATATDSFSMTPVSIPALRPAWLFLLALSLLGIGWREFPSVRVRRNS